MEALFLSGSRALKSLTAPGMFSVFVSSVLITVAALAGFVFGTYTLLDTLFGGSDSIIPVFGTLGALIVAWLLFPGIMPIIINFFDEHIAGLIERADYPNTPQPLNRAFWPEFLHDARFTGIVILLNIIVLPLYLIPLLNLFVFFGLNGYLLGREFFIMAARRHIPIAEALALHTQHRHTITIAGAALTFLATIPFLNLIAPFWGIAMMVHLYHFLTQPPRA